MLIKLQKLLYIFQSAEYDIPFFLNWLKNCRNLESYFDSNKARIPIWTAKAKIIFLIAFLFFPIFFVFQKYLYYSLIFGAFIVRPFEKIAVFFIVWRAKRKLNRCKNLIKIGITGSYGKTTAKEFLSEMLSVKFRVLKTPENINTLLGVSRLILRDLDENIQFLIVEMAAYKKGDINRLCKLINPQIRIITGLASSHLERFGSLENIIKGKFEIARGIKISDAFFLNADNFLIVDNYRKFAKIEPEFFGLNPDVNKKFSARNIKVSADGLEFEVLKNGGIYLKTKVNVFGRHQIESILLVISVADQIGFSKEEIASGLDNLRPIARRLFLSRRNDIIFIDDSYNISRNSAEAALNFLKETFPQKRKIVISAGLVEQGEKSKENNIWFGEKIKENCDLALIIKSSNTDFIVSGMNLSKSGNSEYDNLRVFDNVEELNANLSGILKPGDAVLIFPYDLPAHYC